jgi:hypothetical protein
LLNQPDQNESTTPLSSMMVCRYRVLHKLLAREVVNQIRDLKDAYHFAISCKLVLGSAGSISDSFFNKISRFERLLSQEYHAMQYIIGIATAFESESFASEDETFCNSFMCAQRHLLIHSTVGTLEGGHGRQRSHYHDALTGRCRGYLKQCIWNLRSEQPSMP